ncbi:FUSC family protein [Streptomyces sp. NPDC051555]|uniref:FUSC family protein n=1 Tax=Streptomyces sp. NPDC051555 TaxID=3365657 RepID=UPI00379D376E
MRTRTASRTTSRTGWLHAVTRIKPIPVERALVVRGAIGMAVPLVVGQLVGQPLIGAAAGLGAYGAAVDDSSAPVRTRALALALPQLGGAIGLALGRAAGGSAWLEVLAVTLVAGCSGLLSTIGRITSMTTLVWLLATVMGLGLPTTTPWWQNPLLFLLGGLPLMFLSLAGALHDPYRGERAAVAAAHDAVADLLEADPATWASARHRVTEAMDHAHLTLLVHRLRPPRPGSTADRLAARLDVLVAVIAAAPTIRRSRTRGPARYPAALRAAARAVAARKPAPGAAFPRAGTDRTDGTDGTGHEAGAIHAAVDRLSDFDDGAARAHLPRRQEPGARFTGAWFRLVRDDRALVFAARLAVCMGAAQAVASLTDLPHAGWSVLTVALVIRPDLGTVPARLVLRGGGTVAGVLVGLGVLVGVPNGWGRVAVLVVLTALLQAYARRSYAIQTLLLTPIMVLLADPLGLSGTGVPEARLWATLLGCATAFALGYLLWPEDVRGRVPHRLARVYDDLAAYAEHTAAEAPRETSGHELRRRIHRDLAATRAELDRLRTDPRHAHALQDWQHVLDHAHGIAEDLAADAATGPDPDAGSGTGRPTDDTTALATQLRERAHLLRQR